MGPGPGAAIPRLEQRRRDRRGRPHVKFERRHCSDASRPSNRQADGLPPAGPVAPMPAVAAENEFAKQDASDRPLTSQPRPKVFDQRFGSEQSQPSSLPSATSTALGDEIFARRTSPSGSPSQASRWRSSPRSVSTRPYQRTRVTAPALLDSLAALCYPPTISSVIRPPPQATRLPSGSKAIAGRGDEWVMLESRMQTLGSQPIHD